jgi:uncharacterized protein (UPF0335 family)
MTRQVTDRPNNDPAFDMNENAKALAEERKLNVFLDRILAFEKQRNAASEGIRQVWRDVSKAGIDVGEARRALVTRSLRPNT